MIRMTHQSFIKICSLNCCCCITKKKKEKGKDSKANTQHSIENYGNYAYFILRVYVDSWRQYHAYC